MARLSSREIEKHITPVRKALEDAAEQIKIGFMDAEAWEGAAVSRLMTIVRRLDHSVGDAARELEDLNDYLHRREGRTTGLMPLSEALLER